MSRTANTVVALLLAVPVLFGCAPTAVSTESPVQKATTWPASDAGSFDEIGNRVATNPHLQVPQASSIQEACQIYFAAGELDTKNDELYDDKINAEYLRKQAGEITNKEFEEIAGPWVRARNKHDKRYKASMVGVLRAAGYADWKMYSRYDLEGVGDLWRSNIIAGDKVAYDENHPDFQYTYLAFWSNDVRDICLRYRN